VSAPAYGEARPCVGLGWRQPHYQALMSSRPALDFLEVHSENFFGEGGAARAVLLQGRAHYPISLHGVGLSLGSALGVDPVHLRQLADLVKRVDPMLVSDHASFARGLWRDQVVHAADLLPLPFTDEALAVLCRNVQTVQEALQRPMAVENLSAYLQWQAQDWTEPEFLAELCRRTGCGLVLDVNNLYVNARNQQLAGEGSDPLAACLDWLAALPTQAVAEIHLAGHTVVVDDEGGSMVIDDHGSQVIEPVWQLYRAAVSRWGAVPTLIEWDTAVPALDVLLDEVRRARAVALDVLEAVT